MVNIKFKGIESGEMKKSTEFHIRVFACMVLISLLISYFDNKWGAFFLFGGAGLIFIEKIVYKQLYKNEKD